MVYNVFVDTTQLCLFQLANSVCNLRFDREGHTALAFGNERVSTKSKNVSIPTTAENAADAQPGQW